MGEVLKDFGGGLMDGTENGLLAAISIVVHAIIIICQQFHLSGVQGKVFCQICCWKTALITSHPRVNRQLLQRSHNRQSIVAVKARRWFIAEEYLRLPYQL